MLDRKGIRNYLASTLPSRQFSFIVDPKCLPSFQETPYENSLQLVIDLKLVSPSVEITIFFPDYLGDSSTQQLAKILNPIVSPIKEPEDLSAYIPDSSIPDDCRKSLLQEQEEAVRVRKLLALSKRLHADGVITSSKLLIDAQYPIYQHECIRVVPLDEFPDLIEVCAHGHSLFWSASNHSLPFNLDVFYPLAHWKNSRLSNWFEKTRLRIANDELKDQLRSALLNRYPFILYSRDMVKFYQLQKDHSARRQLIPRFGVPLGYYVNTFYLMLWGMLEQLTLITKYACSLSLDERQCGIRNPQFRQELKNTHQSLDNFLLKPPIGEWIDVMADMRHTAAHKIIPMPTSIRTHTKDSQKSDEEILTIIKEEDPDSLMLGLDIPSAILSSETLKWIQDNAIFRWRLDKMKLLMDHAVLIKGKGGEYFRGSVISVDYDLQMLTAIMDAFVITLFSAYKFNPQESPK